MSTDQNPANERRRYRSESRQAEAEQTKKRILDAAKTLFSQQGFDKATIGGVAELAGVSAPYVYALYKSKEGLLRELVHSTAFGPEYQALVTKVLTNSDPLECLRTAASITRLVCEAERSEIGLIRGSTVLSPALKALEEEGEQIRYERQEVLARRLFDANVVLPEIDFATARDILWGLTSREMYRLMVIERKWAPDRFESWLADTLIKTLIREDRITAE